MDITPTWTALLDSFIAKSSIRCSDHTVEEFLFDMAKKLDHVIEANKRGLVDLQSIPDELETAAA